LRPVEAAARALGRQIVIVKREPKLKSMPLRDHRASGSRRAVRRYQSFFFSRRRQLVALAARHALPATYAQRAFVRDRRSDELRRQ